MLFPQVTEPDVDAAVLAILNASPEGLRNAEVWAALGLNKVTDPKQWISFRSLSRMQATGQVEKRAIKFGSSKKPQQRYFSK